MDPTREQMHQWYVVERKSYRQIMDILGINSARKIKKLLTEYGIEIRKGSAAVKTQWENNDVRRKQQGEIFRKAHEGKPSHRRLTDEELQKRIDPYYLKLISSEYIDGYTQINAVCTECGSKIKTSMRIIFGCRACATKRNTEKQRIPFETVQCEFDKLGMVLLDTQYHRASQPLAFICPRHAHLGTQYVTYADLKIYGCCSTCRMEHRREKYGYAPDERDSITGELKEWRVAVFARDKYTCQCCGDKRGGNLEAHHILNFKTHEHLRLDIDNGITLCEDCHNPRIKGSFHHTYGVRNNTREQLEEYIAMKQQSLA